MQSTVLSSIPPTSSVYAEIACPPSVDSPWVVRRRWMKDKKDNTVVISLFWGVLLPLPILISYILRKIEHNGQLKIETPVLAKVYVNRVCNALQKDLNAIFGENKLYVEVKKTDSEYLQDGKLLLYPMNIESMRVLSDPLNVEVGVPGAMNDPCVFLTQPFYMLAVSYLHNDGCYSEIQYHCFTESSWIQMSCNCRMSRQIRLRCHGGHTIETMEETMTRCGKLSLFLSHTGGSEYRVPFNYSIVTKLLQYTRTLNVQYLDEVPLYWRDILGLSFQEGLDGIHMGETIQIGDDDFFVSDVILALIPQWTLVASEIAEEEFAAILEGLLQVYYKREKEDLESLEKEYSEVLHLLGYSGCPWPTKEKQKDEEEKRNKRDMILFVSPLLGSPMCTHIATLWRNGMLCYSEIWRNDTQRLWLTWKGELEFEYVQVDMF